MGRTRGWSDVVRRALGKIADTMCVSILFFVCCLPVFTVGAAHSALYYAVYKSVRNDRGYVTQEFLRGFKENFARATGGWLIVLACFAFFGTDLYLVSRWEVSGTRIAFLALFVLLLFAVLCVSLYLFPYLARFDDGVKRSLANAARLALAGFAKTVLLGLLAVGGVALCALFPPAILLVPGLYAIIATGILEKAFRRAMSEEDRALEDERNRVY